MNNYRTSRRRTGFSIVELLATLSLLLLIAITGVSMLSTVTEIGLKNRNRTQIRLDVARLASRFRADVHTAQKVALGKQTKSIELTLNDRVVRYRFDGRIPAMIRQCQMPSQPNQFDQFGLTRQCDPEFSTKGRLVTLRLTAGDSRNPWIIQAVRP